MAKANENESAVVIRMPASLHKAIKKRAAEEDRAMAATIRTALREYLKKKPR
jgi:hypothetical protein